MRTSIFFLFLALFSQLYSCKNKVKTRFLLRESLTDEELMDFPVNTLKDDCDNLDFFDELLQDRITLRTGTVNKIKLALDTIEETKILILKIINIEKKLESQENQFLQSKNSLKSSLSTRKRVLTETKDNFNDVIEKLDGIYELLSAKYQKDVDDLDDLLKKLSTASENEHTRNIEKCKEIISLLSDIEEILEKTVDDIKAILTKLSSKRKLLEVYLGSGNC